MEGGGSIGNTLTSPFSMAVFTVLDWLAFGELGLSVAKNSISVNDSPASSLILLAIKYLCQVEK